MRQQIEKVKIFGWLSGAGLVIGAVVGSVDALFGRVLLAITDFRMSHVWLLLPFLALVGVGIVYMYQRVGGEAAKGMNLVFEVGHGEEEVIPKRLIPLVILGTWLTHLFGGSAGREGVAVQIGATFGNWFERQLPITLKNGKTIFLVAGMAAGFAGLFQTPIAAIFFAMEVLVVGFLHYQALLPAVVAAFTASNVSHALGLEKFTFPLQGAVVLDLATMGKLVGLGLLFGIVGKLFAHSLKQLKTWLTQKLANPLLRIAVIGSVLSVLLLLLGQGRYSGLGTNLISASFTGTIYDWDWLLKLALTVLTLAAGYQGGEVTPLFSIGATLGAAIAPLVGLPLPLVAALGYASVFGGATNTFLAPLFIGAEVFGFAYLPYFFIVSSFAHIVNRQLSIYGLQKVVHGNLEMKRGE